MFDLLQLALGFGLAGAAEELAERFQELTGPCHGEGEEDAARCCASRLLAPDECDT